MVQVPMLLYIFGEYIKKWEEWPLIENCRLLKLAVAIIDMACGLLMLHVSPYVKTAVVDWCFTHYKSLISRIICSLISLIFTLCLIYNIYLNIQYTNCK